MCSLEHATLLSQGRSLVDVLEQGVQRLDGKLAFHDWKVWRWPNEDVRWAEARVFRWAQSETACLQTLCLQTTRTYAFHYLHTRCPCQLHNFTSQVCFHHIVLRQPLLPYCWWCGCVSPHISKRKLSRLIDQCRQFVEAVHIQDDLMRFMPKGDATKAEADALQTRM